MQPQQPPVSDPYSYGGGQQHMYNEPAVSAPAPAPAPAPAIFTPESPVSGGQNLLGPSGQQFTSTPSGQHVPDQPGPGYSPAVSNGSGWNDPPPMMTKAPSKQEATVTSSAITQPLFGAPEPTQPPAAGNAGPGGWAGFTPAPVPQQTPGPAAPSYQGGYFQPQEPAPPANQPAPAPAPLAAPPAPIPAEHQVIQDTLESLRSKCQQVAAHPQVRRKLDDVSHKLDILYDKLRAQCLSPATLQGLHTILQHIWQYDYQGCMQVISGLIAGGSFAEMSDFMPGVKVLLQLAQQQGVYVEYQK